MGEAFPILLFFGLIAAAMWFKYYNEESKIKRRLMQNKPSKIQDVQDGAIVKIVGQVKVEETPLEAPFSGQMCVYYVSTVQESSSRDDNAWDEVLRESKSMDFWVEDETGRALVRASTLKIAVIKDNDFASGLFKDAPERLERFLARHGQKSTGWVLNRSLKYKEGTFAIDESIAVLGKARWEHDPDPQNAGKGYRDSPKRLVLDVTPEGYVFASDSFSALK